MPVFIASIFLSAFLLFQVQPIIARYILPWFGGSPTVWTTCMLCFQVGLLAGYAYAHGLASLWRTKPKRQVAVHLGLLLVSLVFLPVTPSEALKPTAETDPTLGIVLLILTSVGLPFIVVSASAPLMQHWFASAFPGRSPYRLYAVSNSGSLLALISYPLAFEHWLGLREQTWVWSVGFVVYGLLVVLCGRLLIRSAEPNAADEPASPGDEEQARPSWWRASTWIALSALGSVLLLATTNRICQDVAVVPFLWVLPLSLYLLSFILCFDHPRWSKRGVWVPATALGLTAMAVLLGREAEDLGTSLLVQIAVHAAAMFFACMICHGELARIKPSSRHLTAYYLTISLGGALGGLLVSQIAPRLFLGYWEYHYSLLAVALTVAVAAWKLVSRSGGRTDLRVTALALVLLPGFLFFAWQLWAHSRAQLRGAVVSMRGFYGVLRVTDGTHSSGLEYKSLYHGRINHGEQHFHPGELHPRPTTYFLPESGVGRAFEFHPKRQVEPPQPIRVGIVGLGVGTLASYAEPGDRFRIYEINPQVEALARSQFTFLSACRGDVEVVLGDARMTLERELERGEPQAYDILVLDAFSGDSVPVHLMTREAFELYLQHLEPDGILVVQVTNLYLDLTDPVRNLAADLGLQAEWIPRDAAERHEYFSSWILLSRDPATLRPLAEAGHPVRWQRPEPLPVRWTDDRSNLFEVLY